MRPTSHSALDRSEARLAALERLSEEPWLSDDRRKVIANLVRAQAAIVAARRTVLAGQN